MTYQIIPAVCGILIYVFFAFMQFRIGVKTDIKNNWMAFIPFLNVFHLVMIIGKSVLIFLLHILVIAGFAAAFFFLKDSSFIPLIQQIGTLYILSVCLFYGLIICFELPHAVGLSRAFGILLLIPIIQMFAFAYLAFCKEGSFSKEVGFSWLFIILLYGAPLILFMGQMKLMFDTANKTFGQFEKSGSAFNISNFSINKTEKPENEILTKSEIFYLWKDGAGNEHYVTSLKEIPPEYQQNVEQISSDSMKGDIKLMNAEDEGNLITDFQGVPQPEQFKDGQHNILIYTYENDKNRAETEKYFNKFNMPYTILDVIKDPENAIVLKQKLGLDINKKYTDIIFPVLEIDGQIIKRIETGKNQEGKVVSSELNTKEINKAFGLRETFE